jgi:myo-inositol-1(or 4)-monophosphatase
MLEEELRIATEAVLLAGAEVARFRRDGVRYGRKDGWELVSEADLRAAEMLFESLTKAFPDTGWLGEEHADSSERLGRERVWIVDPIDGTREYLQGVPEYAISVGLVIAGEPVLGVVYNPAKEQLSAALCVGCGEAPPLAVPRRFEALVGRGESRLDEIPPLPPGGRATGVGSVAYRLALLAGGRGNAVLTGYGRSEWDVAAGAALCIAAGLRVTDVLGEPLRFNKPDPYIRGLLVAEPGLHAHIAKSFERLRRD